MHEALRQDRNRATYSSAGVDRGFNDWGLCRKGTSWLRSRAAVRVPHFEQSHLQFALDAFNRQYVAFRDGHPGSSQQRT